jgi:hypothetical protein
MVATLILRDIFGKMDRQAANGPFRLPVHVPVLFPAAGNEKAPRGWAGGA